MAKKTQREVCETRHILDLSDEEVKAIYFALKNKVDRMAKSGGQGDEMDLLQDLIITFEK